MSTNTMTVDAKFITRGQSFRGGWNKRQFEILGFDWPPPPGWRRMALGRELPASLAEKFLSLKQPRPD